jgi:two-component sensor histidine kinase
MHTQDVIEAAHPLSGRQGGSRRRRARSIQWHLSVLCLVFMLPILGLVAWLLWQYTGAERLRLEQQRIETLDRVAGAVERELALLKAMAELAASAPALSGEPRAAEAGLRQLSERLSMHIVLRSSDGRPLVSTGPTPAVTGPQEEDKQVLELRRAVVGTIPPKADRPATVVVTAPVVRPGTVESLSLLSFVVDPERLRRIVAREEHAEGVHTSVLDASGAVIAGFGSPDSAPATSALPSGGGMAGRYRAAAQNGEPIQVEYTRTTGADWTVVAALSQRALTEPTRRWAWQLLAIALVLAALSALLAFTFGRRIYLALEELGAAAASLGRDGVVREVDTGIAQVNAVGRALRFAGRSIREGQQQQTLLNRELHHRVKNTLATVQALIRLSARSAESAQALQESLTQRVASLASTHDLLIGTGWSAASLETLLKKELAAYDDPAAERITLAGPPAELPPDVALALGMMVHELATNAAKYGALSVPHGKLRVDWELAGEGTAKTVALTWRESGVPQSPETGRQGFGSDLLDRLARQLGAVVEKAFEAEGLRVSLVVPLESAP